MLIKRPKCVCCAFYSGRIVSGRPPRPTPCQQGRARTGRGPAARPERGSEGRGVGQPAASLPLPGFLLKGIDLVRSIFQVSFSAAVLPAIMPTDRRRQHKLVPWLKVEAGLSCGGTARHGTVRHGTARQAEGSPLLRPEGLMVYHHFVYFRRDNLTLIYRWLASLCGAVCVSKAGCWLFHHVPVGAERGHQGTPGHGIRSNSRE